MLFESNQTTCIRPAGGTFFAQLAISTREERKRAWSPNGLEPRLRFRAYKIPTLNSPRRLSIAFDHIVVELFLLVGEVEINVVGANSDA